MRKTVVFVVGFLTGVATIVLAVSAAVVTFFCPVANPGLVNAMLFKPLKEFDEHDLTRDVLGVKAEDVYIKTGDDSVKLHGRLYLQKSPHLVLFSHGQGGNLSMLPLKLVDLVGTGSSVFAYDYRGYGKSTGKPSIEGVLADARAAYEYVIKNTKYSARDIILYGESLGSGVTSDLARNVECAGVVLESAFISPEAMGKEIFPLLSIYPESLFPNPGLSNLPLMAKSKHPPILLMAGKRDPFIPCHHSQYLFDHATKPVEIALFDKCGHGYFGPQRSEFQGRLKEFFKECSKNVETGQYAVQALK